MIDPKAGKAVPNWMIWALAALPLMGFWLTGLFDLDEGFYAAVVGEMLYRREWITPFYNGAPWFEKPILLYWLAMPFVSVFGEMVGPRLPAVLTALGTYWAVWSFTRRYVDEFTAKLAVLLLSGSLIFALLGRLMMTDMPLVMAEVLAYLCFWRSFQDGAKWRYWAAFWLGVSVLAKGPVGCAFFVLLVAVTYWREPALRPKLGGWGSWAVGTCVLIATVATWYLPAYLTNGQLFVQEFLIEQNVNRFTGGDKAHTLRGVGSYFFYLPILIVGTLPWTPYIFRAWPRGRSEDERSQFLRFNARWAWIVFVFFTISSAKLPHYILPVFPALAIVVGAWLAQRWREQGFHDLDARVIRAPALTAVVIAVILNAGIYWYYTSANLNGRQLAAPHQQVHDLTRWARKQGDDIAVFQMNRRDKRLGTGELRIQETNHPSMVFYAGRPILKAEEPTELLKATFPVNVLTRPGRFTPEVLGELQRSGVTASRVSTGLPDRFFEAWRLERK